MTNKIRLGIITAVATALLVSGVVNAGSITTYSAVGDTGQITITGKVEDDVHAVQTFVYDETGKTLVAMQSVAVNDDGTFADVITVSKGKYTVKTADYDGGEYKTTIVEVKGSSTDSSEDTTDGNKKTEENKHKAVPESDKKAPVTGER